MEIENPYTPPASHDGRERAGRFARWLLLPVPLLVCGSILYASTFLRVGLLHLLMIAVLPLGLSIGSAVAISSYLVRPPWHRLMIALYAVALFFMWSYVSTTYRLNPFP